MRLKNDDLDIIIKVLDHFSQSIGPGELKLYGSRTDMNASGGDIDLVFLSDHLDDKKLSWTHRIKSKLCSELDMDHIDFKIIDRNHDDSFFKLALEHAILIKKY